MCQRTNCRTCGKATYRGCGNHVEQVLAGVPKSQRCQGNCEPSQKPSGGFWSRLRRK